MKINPEAKDVTSQIYGTNFHIDDETAHHEHAHKIADPEEPTHKATRGAIRAQQGSVPVIFKVVSVAIFAIAFCGIIFDIINTIMAHQEFKRSHAQIEYIKTRQRKTFRSIPSLGGYFLQQWRAEIKA